MKSVKYVTLFATGALLLGVASAQANSGTSAIQNNKPKNVPLTEQQLRAMHEAKPMRNPLPPPADAATSKAETAPAGLIPGASTDETNRGGSEAFGSFGVPFTDARVALGDSNQAKQGMTTWYLSSTRPYSSIVRLTFQSGSGTSLCSGSVIKRAVVVTAAHCIQNFGSNSNVFSGWKFVPGEYADGTVARQPYGVWDWALVNRPTSWINGTDTGSGSARNNDVAVFIIEKNADGKFIGDLVGQLGYAWNNYSFKSHARTGNLSTAATTTLGYPGLFDAGIIMQRADGPSYLTTVSNAKQIYQGNSFTGGASGGPWIVNFKAQTATYSGGASGGTDKNANTVIGVTSWGTSDPNNPKDNYSSQFGQNTEFPNAKYGSFGAGNIGALLNDACKVVKSGGTKTFKQLGYCD